MKKYTLAFILNKELDKVLLVKKKSPEWQKGKLNGVGGKFEEGENELQCIEREVFEETGVKIPSEKFVYFGFLGNDEWKAYLFVVQLSIDADFTQGVEEIVWCDTKNLPENVITNLSWLIPMAIDKIVGKEFSLIEANYI
jgi:8-oxo-dGTP diphosphatase